MIEYINRDNCKAKTGLHYEELLSCTGILAIHDVKDLEEQNPEVVSYCMIEHSGESYTIEIETTLLINFRVIIYKNTMDIKNDLIESSGKQTGIGFPMLCHQVKAAAVHGFKSIVLHAFGNHLTIKKANGFVTWGKWGYQMADEQDRIKFALLMQQLGRTENNLEDLLQTAEGLEIWKQHGFNWLGIFDLTPGSKSMQILNGVKTQKGYIG